MPKRESCLLANVLPHPPRFQAPPPPSLPPSPPPSLPTEVASRPHAECEEVSSLPVDPVVPALEASFGVV